MRKKIFFLLAVFAIAGFFVLAFFLSKKAPASTAGDTKKPLTVTVQKAADSTSLSQKIEYPAVTAGDQEITVTAQASGTITRLDFDLGKYVSQNTRLATIDNVGNFSSTGENNLESSSIQALELTVKSTEESYKVARDNYRDDDTYANKKAKSIAKINLEIAKTNLDGALDSRYAVSPISGTVTQRFVSLGDSVSAGQTLATISKTGITKVKFYVDKEDLPNFKVGTKITIDEDGNEMSGTISRISPQADLATRRFLIEARPAGKNPLIIGNVITVSFEVKKVTTASENLILPLSAITVGQNENYIFIFENSKAKKTNVEIVKVIGEAAEIKADISPDTQIIIGGSKLVQDGDGVSINSNQ